MLSRASYVAPSLLALAGIRLMSQVTQKSPSRVRRNLLVLLVILGIASGSLPSILGIPYVFSRLLQIMTPEMNLEIGSVSLGWFSRAVFYDVALRDAGGKTIGSAPTIHTERSLFDLLRNRSDLGKLTIDQPRLQMVLTENSSNLEQVFSDWSNGRETSASFFECEIQVIDGTIEIIDQVSKIEWQATHLEVNSHFGTLRQPTFSLSGSLESQDHPTGSLCLSLTADRLALPSDEQNLYEVEFEGMSLSYLQTICRRFLGHITLAGVVDGKVLVRHSACQDLILHIERFQSAAMAIGIPHFEQSEQLHLGPTEIQGMLSLDAKQLSCNGLTIDSPLIHGHVTAALERHTLQQLSELNVRDLNVLGALVTQKTNIHINLNVAQLAQCLPHTLRVREGLTIKRALVELILETKTVDGNRQLVGVLRTDDFVGISQGRNISWHTPCHAEVVIRDSTNGLMMETLSCDAGFAQATAQGSLNHGSITLNAQLDDFVDQAGRFIDLSGFVMQGEIDVHADWQGNFNKEVQLETKLLVKGLQFQIPHDFVHIAGSYDGTLQGVVNKEALRFQEAQVTVHDFELDTAAIAIIEPQIHFVSTGEWHFATRSFQSKETTFTSSALAFRSNDFRAQWRTNPELDIYLGFRGDLERLGRWLPEAYYPQHMRLVGESIGKLHLVHHTRQTTADFSVNLHDMTIAKTNPTRSLSAGTDPFHNASQQESITLLFEESLATTYGSICYDHSKKQLSIDQLAITPCRGLNFSITNSQLDLGKQRLVRIQGSTQYDLKALVSKLRNLVGADVNLSGVEEMPFLLEGCYAPTMVSGHSALAWDRADLFGFGFGAGNLDIRFDQSSLLFGNLEASVNEGTARLAPRVNLVPSPTLVLQKGRILENVVISAEMCQKWLRYVAPLLADATQAQGRFSLDLSELSVPLDNTSQSQIQGQLHIHRGQIGPGSMAYQIIALVKQVEDLLRRRLPRPLTQKSMPWIVLPTQDVTFSVVDGRVTHEDFQMLVGNVLLRTTGSIGFDHTLKMVVHIPIDDQWINGDRLLAGLRGTSLEIPIAGTVSEPRFDKRVIEQLGKQLLRGATRSLFEDELEKGLQKLFGS